MGERQTIFLSKEIISQFRGGKTNYFYLQETISQKQGKLFFLKESNIKKGCK